MKWRWRRRVKVAPGVTVNLSPTSVGASVGGPAGRVSANTAGRVAVGQSIPGTGLYSQQVLASGAQPVQRQGGGCIQTVILGVVGVMLLFGCGVIGMAMLSVGSRPTTTPTAPARAVEPIPLDTPAPSTATPAVVETTVAVADSRTVLLPLVAGAADAVSVVDAPLPTSVPTDTPWPTEPPPTTAPAYSWVKTIDGVVFGSDCPCDQGDALNCDDFPRPIDAQSCFLRCFEMAGGDVHELDRDTDNSACEWQR